ncbi:MULTISPECIES: hypothetical protein [Brevibacillus]|nr:MULTISPECIES: hypothetical protein [Brevibacillus]MCM3080426.1 hypothetical protein [Brevibacillus invocatus]MCM3430652.1 hypothetical protein [Brevibacillus invocatus]MDH4618890.1 hypothetical protein [Brevibacillus sp. AY1]
MALDELGNVLRAKELTGIGSVNPRRMRTLIQVVKDPIHPGEKILH